MNRTDYELVARVIRNEILDKLYSSPHRKAIEKLVDRMCMEFKKDSNRFNEDRFRAACDMEKEDQF